MIFSLTALVVACGLSASPEAPAPAPFELKTGDRVVWIGNTLVEREQRYGYWETALLAAYPDKNITFRNLGWSGDTVFGDARAGFDTPAKGFERLVSLTLELKPTVIFVSYGTNESFEGEVGLATFEKGLNKLLDALKPSNARVVLLSPLPVQKAPGLHDPTARNAALALYNSAIRRTAVQRGLRFADLDLVGKDLPPIENGIHLDGPGYEATASLFLKALGLTQPTQDPSRLDPLRTAVVAKNQLFFYKWRPQNETYLTGFRKHEQGKNAKEIVEFDPLIVAAEDEIAKQLKALTK